MLVWGKRSENLSLGSTGAHYCRICERERSFSITLHYEWSHLYWVFGQVSKKQYIQACDICHRGALLDSGEFEKHLDENPIPFMRRRGWLFPAAGLIGFVVFVAASLFH
jgi:hypothetical protein